MFSQLPQKENAKYYAVIALALGGVVYLGASAPDPPAKITFENLGPVNQAVSPEKPKEVVVHVSGAVRRPGVYRLKADSRVHDAIREAGGAKENGSLENWNLAAKLVDGSNIHIESKIAKVAGSSTSTRKAAPRSSEITGIAPFQVDVPDEYKRGSFPSMEAVKVEPERSASASRDVEPPASSVSLNTANSAQLEQLPGVGPSTAAKILEYRRENGGFTSIEELLAVKGIGPKKLESMRKYLRL